MGGVKVSDKVEIENEEIEENLVEEEAGDEDEESEAIGMPVEQDDPMSVIEVNSVSKRFCRDLKRSLFYGLKDIGREVIGKPANLRLRKQEFWALKDVSFNLPKGESLGLVGRNGCGKTTLMRIISGLIKPTHGKVTVRGRLAPLLALGAGFNHVLTGRENIYVNMAVLGLTKKEIDERFDEVVEFSEIKDALDAPVQTYSSGMTARLGFACAIHSVPDVLLLDEVFAVGDLQFRQKCFGKLSELRQNGTSFILVSHMPSIVLGLCTKAVYIKDGQMVMGGSAEEVIDCYEEDLHLAGRSRPGAVSEGAEGLSSDFELKSISFRDAEDNPMETLMTARPARLVMEMRANVPIEGFHGVISFIRLSSIDPEDCEEIMRDEEGVVLQLANHLEKCVYDLETGTYTYGFSMRRLGLRAGLYKVRVELFAKPDKVLATHDKFRFLVKSRVQIDRSHYYQPRAWFLEPVNGRGQVRAIRGKGAGKIAMKQAVE